MIRRIKWIVSQLDKLMWRPDPRGYSNLPPLPPRAPLTDAEADWLKDKMREAERRDYGTDDYAARTRQQILDQIADKPPDVLQAIRDATPVHREPRGERIVRIVFSKAVIAIVAGCLPVALYAYRDQGEPFSTAFPNALTTTWQLALAILLGTAGWVFFDDWAKEEKRKAAERSLRFEY